MGEQPAKPKAASSKAHTLRRLLVTFLPHTPIVLATLLATALHSATMTARMVSVYPLLRLFAKEVPAEQPGEAGQIQRILTAADGEASPALKRVNDFLDTADEWWASHLEFVVPEKVYADLEKRAKIGTIATTVSIFAVVALIAAITAFFRHVLKELLVVKIIVSLRVKLLKNLLRQPLAFYNEQKRGELISRMSADVQSATICLQTLTGPVIENFFRIVAAGWLIVKVKWWFLFILLGYIAILAFSVIRQSRKVHRRARVRQRTTARVTEAMVQMFSGIRVVKAFGLEGQKVSAYEARNKDFVRDAMSTEVAKAFTRARMDLLTHCSILFAVIVIGIIIGSGGSVPPGIVIALLLLLGDLYRPIKQFTYSYTDLQDHLAGAQRTYEFMDLKPALTDKRDATIMPAPVGTVRFEDVSFAYNGNGKVLNHINLEVPAGQVVALVGPSGAGKSTLVNLVPRFYDPDEGRVSVDGTDIREFTRSSLLEHIAVVTQEAFLFNASIRENIAYGKPGATNEEIEAAAKAAEAHDFIGNLPRGYDTVVGERGANLSGGQGQRVTIARALIRDAKILILDEATSNLDTESERAVQEALKNLMKGRTTLVIAHRLSTVQHADKICVMQDGRICEMGTHTQLMDSSASVYRRLYELQFAPK
jgi:subfamily B ATP-binding cassette protein MsbA